MKTAAIFFLFLLLCAFLVAQTEPKPAEPVKEKLSVMNAAPTDSGEILEPQELMPVSSPFTSFEFLLSIIVLFFGLIVVTLEVYLASKGIIRSEYVYKCIIITLVIVGSIVLITAGYSNNQINGVIGILGSIAGYMLAKGARGKQDAS